MADAPAKKPAPATSKPTTPAKTGAPAKASAAPSKQQKNVVAKAAPKTPAPKGEAGNPYYVVFHPVVTEKTMFNMDKNNSLEFLVATTANKPEIAKAVETLFSVKVAKVTTRITRDGKRAVVKFAEGYSAEDIGMQIGVF